MKSIIKMKFVKISFSKIAIILTSNGNNQTASFLDVRSTAAILAILKMSFTTYDGASSRSCAFVLTDFLHTRNRKKRYRYTCCVCTDFSNTYQKYGNVNVRAKVCYIYTYNIPLQSSVTYIFV